MVCLAHAQSPSKRTMTTTRTPLYTLRAGGRDCAPCRVSTPDRNSNQPRSVITMGVPLTRPYVECVPGAVIESMYTKLGYRRCTRMRVMLHAHTHARRRSGIQAPPHECCDCDGYTCGGELCGRTPRSMVSQPLQHAAGTVPVYTQSLATILVHL